MVSRVAGILDRNRNLRIVVTDGSLYAHLTDGDELFIVPGVTVQEPVDVRDWPKLVKIVEDHIRRVA